MVRAKTLLSWYRKKQWWGVGIVVVIIVVAIAAGSSSTKPTGSSSSTKPTGFAALTGKRLSGTSSAWLPIASPAVHPVDVAGTSTPPVLTRPDNAYKSVTFFDFPSSASAAAFYSNPPQPVLTASPLQELPAVVGGGIQPLAGATATPTPSQWLDLRECVYSASSAVPGSPSGGIIDAAGNCSKGTPTSIGIAMIIQRGPVVVLVQTLGGVLSPAPITTATNIDAYSLSIESQNQALAISALDLLHAVGLEATAPIMTTTTLPTVVQQLTAAEATFNQVNEQVGNQVQNLGNDATISQVVAAEKPLLTAATQYETTLKAIDWPPAEDSDAKASIVAVGSLISVLQSVGSQTVPSAGDQVAGALVNIDVAVNALRHDFGLRAG
jgi:hypothetical protein